ncbi:serine hydrolase [Agrococcus sp. KRD186]|uniref:serine hydrolase n=1 Tax=Agrococcus sp. KRD186 TaxID=2729730 RepID=UPI0019D2290E|nr:serine hydrolase [Agrococcus sp. KRD186]
MSPTHPPLTGAAAWSVLVRDAATGETVLEHQADAVRSAASVPKLLLLATCAALIEAGELAADEPLDRASVAPVGDSGIWQHLAQRTLTVDDAATLVGAASDNLATNVLLERVGTDAVARESARLRVGDVVLHDAVRDERLPEHPPRLGSASAAGLVALLSRLEAGTLGSPAVSERVRGWLRHSLDLSMVASAFALDPLAHGAEASPISLVNKTGTDSGVRADAGIVRGRSRTLVYAAIANWPAAAAGPAGGGTAAGATAAGGATAGGSTVGDARFAVLASMRAIGELLREAVESDRG